MKLGTKKIISGMVLLLGCGLVVVNHDQIFRTFQFTKKIYRSTQRLTEAIPDIPTVVKKTIDRLQTANLSGIVRRSSVEEISPLSMINEIVINEQNPFIVWENPGSKYWYQLQVGQNYYWIPSSDESHLRIRMWPFKGRKEIKLSVYQLNENSELKIAEKLEIKPEEYTVRWQEYDEQARFQEEISKIKLNRNQGISYGKVLEKYKLWVVAMDHYQTLAENDPGNLDIAPYLFKVYKKLKLQGIYHQDLIRYRVAMLQ